VRKAQSLLLLLSAALLPACSQQLEQYSLLAEQHAVAQGRVQYRDCGNGGAVYYRFSVGQQEFGGRAPKGSIDCTAAKVGDPLVIYFHPSNPQIHSNVEPAHLYKAESSKLLPGHWPMIVWVGLACMFPIGFWFNAVFLAPRRSTVKGSKADA